MLVDILNSWNVCTLHPLTEPNLFVKLVSLTGRIFSFGLGNRLLMQRIQSLMSRNKILWLSIVSFMQRTMFRWCNDYLINTLYILKYKVNLFIICQCFKSILMNITKFLNYCGYTKKFIQRNGIVSFAKSIRCRNDAVNWFCRSFQNHCFRFSRIWNFLKNWFLITVFNKIKTREKIQWRKSID